MGEAIEKGSGQTLGAEHLGPLIEGQIACDDDRSLLVTLAEHLEEQLGAGLRERDEAQLVDDQQFVSAELLLQAE